MNSGGADQGAPQGTEKEAQQVSEKGGTTRGGVRDTGNMRSKGLGNEQWRGQSNTEQGAQPNAE